MLADLSAVAHGNGIAHDKNAFFSRIFDRFAHKAVFRPGVVHPFPDGVVVSGGKYNAVVEFQIADFQRRFQLGRSVFFPSELSETKNCSGGLRRKGFGDQEDQTVAEIMDSAVLDEKRLFEIHIFLSPWDRTGSLVDAHFGF